MKKTVLALLSLALLLSLAACGAPAPVPAEPTPAAEQDAPTETLAPAPEESVTEEPEMALRFSTTMLDGTAADESLLKEHRLTMINFFEPWCPPCVRELPDLEALYEAYRDEGFQILGVFSTEEGTAQIVEQSGLQYPVLRYTEAFDPFQTGYVPTTVFVDEHGAVVGESVIGGHSYAEWEKIVKGLLG